MKKQFGALFLSLVMVIGCSSTALAAEVGIERNTFSEKAGEQIAILIHLTLFLIHLQKL